MKDSITFSELLKIIKDVELTGSSVYCYKNNIDEHKQALKDLGFVLDNDNCKDFNGCILWDDLIIKRIK